MQQLITNTFNNTDYDNGSAGGEVARHSTSSNHSNGGDDYVGKGCLRRGASDSEPGTPTMKNPERPMHRNLSDLGPRVKKRVTYKSAHVPDLEDRERPLSLSDMNTPHTPILKRTLQHAQHIPVEPDIKESPRSFCGILDYSDIFSSSSPLLPKHNLRHARCLKNEHHYIEAPSLCASNSQHIIDHSNSYFDTTIEVQTDDSDSLRTLNSFSIRRSSPPLKVISQRQNTTSSYNSSESELLSDMEEGILIDTDDKPNDNSSQNSVFDSETVADIISLSSTCTSIHPVINHDIASLLPEAVQPLTLVSATGDVPDNKPTELNTFRRKPESKAFLMRPEVLKLKKTSC